MMLDIIPLKNIFIYCILQVHVRVNHLHVAKPYRCLFCSESFTSEMELQCHLTTHSKPFRCPMCEQAFHIEYLLDQHLQTDHGDSDCKGTALLHNRASSLALIPIKEETESLPLAQLLASRSPRPPSWFVRMLTFGVMIQYNSSLIMNDEEQILIDG